MPRYFFHTADGGRDRDREGTELPDRDAARVAAVRYAGEVLSDQPEMLVENGQEFRVQVTDADGTLLFTIITLAVDTAEAT